MNKAIIFDMDGVIFDSERLVLESWKPVAAKYNIKDIEKACFECLGLNVTLTNQKMKQRYGEDFPYEIYKKEASANFHEMAKDGKLPKKEGVIELLTYLKENGYKVALASSTRRAVVEQELKEGGLYDYFDAVICGDMVEHGKPDPEIFIKACRLVDVKEEDAYVIEDSYNGIRAAARARIKAFMVVDMAPPTDEMRQLAFKIYDSLFEVLDYLKEN